jgi:hypothetical protein
MPGNDGLPVDELADYFDLMIATCVKMQTGK